MIIPVLLMAALAWQTTPGDLLKKCQAADDRNAEMERNYVFEQRTENRMLDDQGKVTRKTSETFDTIISGGRPFQRLIAKNDVPLSEADEKKELSKERREESLAKAEEKRKKNRELAHDALNAFQVRVVGEDAGNWILDATPKPGFEPHSRETAVLKHFRAKIWISKKDYVWTRIDAEAMDDVSFGWVIFRLDKGAHVRIERTLVNGEVWLPKQMDGGGEARIALVKKMRVEFETKCSKYKRYSADSRMVTDPVK